MGRSNFGSNLPPGASSDPRAPYNQPDHSHEHQWESYDQHIAPIIEDGAAIFKEQCMYAEGRWGEGWECEETRTYRFEYSSLEDPEGRTFDVPPLDEWEKQVPIHVVEAIIRIEEAYHTHGPGDEVSFDADPDPDEGVVTIEYDGYTLRYEP